MNRDYYYYSDISHKWINGISFFSELINSGSKIEGVRCCFKAIKETCDIAEFRLTIIDVGYGTYEDYQSGFSSDKIIYNTAINTVVDVGGLALSVGIGNKVGTVVGTFIGGIPGAVIGCVVGGLIGYGIGYAYNYCLDVSTDANGNTRRRRL